MASKHRKSIDQAQLHPSLFITPEQFLGTYIYGIYLWIPCKYEIFLENFCKRNKKVPEIVKKSHFHCKWPISVRFSLLIRSFRSKSVEVNGSVISIDHTPCLGQSSTSWFYSSHTLQKSIVLSRISRLL